MNDKQIEALRNEFHMPAHIRDHCDQVAKIADNLGKKILAGGHELNLIDLHAAARLHDLFRVCDIKRWQPENFERKVSAGDLRVWKGIREKFAGQSHWNAIYSLLKERNEVEIGEIAFRHNLFSILDEKMAPRTLEEKILFYADKRVAHTEIVTLQERFAEGARRHKEKDKKTQKKVNLAIMLTFKLERELFNLAGISKSAELRITHPNQA